MNDLFPRRRGFLLFWPSPAGSFLSRPHPVSCRRGISSATRASRVLAPHERPLHTFEQLRFVERLAQETDCPALHGSLANALMREGSNENDWQAMIVSDQIFLQLDAAHAGHLYIRNDAGGFGQSGRGQEFLCRSERVYRKSHRPQQPCCRGTHRSIVIDDRDGRDLCHAT